MRAATHPWPVLRSCSLRTLGGLAILLLAGCTAPGASARVTNAEEAIDKSLSCGDLRSSFKLHIVNGSAEPTEVRLSAGQQMAIGKLSIAGGVCTVTALNAHWGITANHCFFPAQGPARTASDARAFFSSAPQGAMNFESQVSIGIKRLVSAEEIKIFAGFPQDHVTDIALVEFDQDPTELIPQMVPLELARRSVERVLRLGTRVEASGYGRTDPLSEALSQTRRFVSLKLQQIGEALLTTSGEGMQGVCHGDSGGPLLVDEGDNTRIVATLWRGLSAAAYEDCRSIDQWSRLDKVREFIEGVTGPTGRPGPASCGLNFEGGCLRTEQGVFAVSCNAAGERSLRACQGNQVCGFDGASQHWSCIAPEADLCQGFSLRGACGGPKGDVAIWCDPSKFERPIQQRDCGACDQSCMDVSRYGGAYCRTNLCGEVSAGGFCDGNTLKFCDEGRVFTVDCAARGQVCVAGARASCQSSQ